jgi:hypothetical protein
MGFDVGAGGLQYTSITPMVFPTPISVKRRAVVLNCLRSACGGLLPGVANQEELQAISPRRETIREWHKIPLVCRFPLKDSASGCVFLSAGHPGKDIDPDGRSVLSESFPHDA